MLNALSNNDVLSYRQRRSDIKVGILFLGTTMRMKMRMMWGQKKVQAIV